MLILFDAVVFIAEVVQVSENHRRCCVSSDSKQGITRLRTSPVLVEEMWLLKYTFDYQIEAQN